MCDSVAELLEHGFTSEFVGWGLSFDSMHDIHNAFGKVVGFLRVLWFPPTGKVDRVGWDSPL